MVGAVSWSAHVVYCPDRHTTPAEKVGPRAAPASSGAAGVAVREWGCVLQQEPYWYLGDMAFNLQAREP